MVKFTDENQTELILLDRVTVQGRYTNESSQVQSSNCQIGLLRHINLIQAFVVCRHTLWRLPTRSREALADLYWLSYFCFITFSIHCFKYNVRSGMDKEPLASLNIQPKLNIINKKCTNFQFKQVALLPYNNESIKLCDHFYKLTMF